MTATTKNSGSRTRKSSIRIAPKTQAAEQLYELEDIQIISSAVDLNTINSTAPDRHNSSDTYAQILPEVNAQTLTIINRPEPSKVDSNNLNSTLPDRINSNDTYIQLLPEVDVQTLTATNQSAPGEVNSSSINSKTSDSSSSRKISIRIAQKVEPTDQLNEFEYSQALSNGVDLNAINSILLDENNSSDDYVQISPETDAQTLTTINQSTPIEVESSSINSKTSDAYSSRKSSIRITPKPLYPIINNGTLPLLDKVNNSTLSNTTISWKAALTAVGINIAVISATNAWMTSQLGIAISNSPLATSIITNHGYRFLVMNAAELDAIPNVGQVRQQQIITFSKSVIHRSAIVTEALDSTISISKLAYEPNINNLYKLTINLNNFNSIYNGANIYSISIATGQAAYAIYQGEYIQALQQGMVASNYMLLSHVVNAVAQPQLGTSYGIVAALGASCIFTMNLYSALNEYMNDTGYLRLMTAYKDVFQVLSATPLRELHDFASLANKYEIDINAVKLNIETENMKQLLNAKGEFGHKLYEYIYAPTIKEKYELLNKIAQGNLTQEQADSSKTKHVTIALENQSYEHCVELKDVSDNHRQHYNCYNAEQEILDHVIIGNDNSVEVHHL